MDFYGSVDATKKTGEISLRPFVYIKTNLCPFITEKAWSRQPDWVSQRLLEACSLDHLEALQKALGESIDLWIGHSAIEGTRWVWPTFAKFLARHSVKEWLLTFNINPQSHLWFEGSLRKKNQKRPWLYAWYGPEKC